MIVPARKGRETTAADHLATDSMVCAVERVRVLLRAAQARIDMNVSSFVENGLSPLRAELDHLETGVNTDDQAN